MGLASRRKLCQESWGLWSRAACLGKGWPGTTSLCAGHDRARSGEGQPCWDQPYHCHTDRSPAYPCPLLQGHTACSGACFEHSSVPSSPDFIGLPMPTPLCQCFWIRAEQKGTASLTTTRHPTLQNQPLLSLLPAEPTRPMDLHHLRHTGRKRVKATNLAIYILVSGFSIGPFS